MKRGKKAIGLAMALFLTFGTVMPAGATSITEAEKKAAQLEAEKKAAEAQKSDLATQLNTIIADMKIAQDNLAQKEAEIEITENELINAKIEENSQYDSMKKRIKYMYENGNIEFIEILVKAESITDFLNKAEYVSQISEYDRKMLVQFQNLVKEIAAKEAKLKEEYIELNRLQDELTAKQGEVEALLAAKSVEISTLQTQIGENAAVLQKLIAEAQEAERKRLEELAYQQALAAQGNSSGGSSGGSYSPGAPSVSGNGQFTHPCPSGSVSSPFGNRDGEFHKGTDYAAGEGSPIYAADSGRVIVAGYSSSAGNWVVIDHGNGIVTKYMHMVSAPFVSSGQSVARGEHIGAVGNTGNSFGNHLHFQVELNGSAVNAESYL